ncbi:MAG: hypothetical protein JJ896_11770 [Rhodothermales bacterium]|nr:hypothetical protein [Rhodothermales bacterium]MBO6780322.1 hypothetical protein [Rhodothermales bacterium]
MHPLSLIPRKYLILLLLWPFFSTTTAAQEGDRFVRIGVEGGLASPETWVALRTENGSLWIGSKQGLQEWEGGQVRTTFNESNSLLANPWVYSLLQTDEGILVAVLDGHPLRLDPTTRSLAAIPVDPACDPIPVELGRPRSLDRVVPGEVWVTTSRAGVISIRDGRLCPVPFASVEESEVATNPTRLVRTPDGAVYMGTRGAGLIRFKWEDGQLSGLESVPGVSLDVNDLVYDPAGYLWLGTSGMGVQRLDLASGEIARLKTLTFDGTGMADTVVWNLLLADGELWIGNQKGLYVFLQQTGRLVEYRHRPGDDSSLCNDDVGKLHADAFGMLWAATDNGVCGVSRTRYGYTIREYRVAPLTAIAPASENGTLWSATTEGIQKLALDGDLKRSEPIPQPSQGRPREPTAMLEQDGAVTMGTAQHGLFRIPRDRPIEKLSLAGAFPTDFSVMDLAAWQGAIAVSTVGEGIGIVRDLSVESFAAGANMLELLAHSSGQLYARPGTGGLTEARSDSSEWDLVGPWATDTLAGAFFTTNDLTEARGGEIFAATDGGVLRWDPESETSSLFDTNQGLPPGGQIAVEADHLGRIWALSSSAASRFDPLRPEMGWRTIRPDPRDGAGQFIQKQLIRVGDRMVAARENGLWSFDPDLEIPPAPEPEITLVASGGTLQGSRLELRRGAYEFEANITLADLGGLEHLRIWTQLHGDDDLPREYRQSMVSQVFRDIPPRREPYRLEIRTLAGNGQTGRFLYDVVVRRPLIQTLWFQLLAGGLILGTVGGSILTRTQRRRREALEIQTALAESREDERKTLQRHIHDGPLQALYTFRHLAEMLHEDGSEETLEEIQKRTDSTIEELRRICANLRPSGLLTTPLERTFRAYCQDFQLDHEDIQVQTDLEAVGMMEEPVAVTAYRVLQSALGNVARHSAASAVDVALRRVGNALEVSVYDNGRGFDSSTSLVALARNRHFGLLGMHEWAKRAGGTLQVLSSRGSGTRLTLTIPVVTD